MGQPVVIVSSGGIAGTSAENGLPVTIATNGFGLAVTVVASGGIPMNGLTPVISATYASVAENAANGSAVSIASIVGGSYTGTPSWSLTEATGTFQINSSTGAITVLSNTLLNYENNPTFSATIGVSGTTPDPIDLPITIYVTNVVEDTTPASFSFTDVTGATISTPYTSNTITISGVDGPSDVTVTGGEYSKNGGAFTSSPGSAVNGDTFAVRATSSGSYSTAVNVVLSVGGNVTTATTDTYTVTTEASGGGTAGQPIGLLLALTKAA